MLSELGGLTNLRYLLKSEVGSYKKTNLGVTITTKNGSEWKSIITSRYGLNVGVTPDRSESGIIYNVTGTISIPPKAFTPELDKALERMDALGSLICFDLANGQTMVVGSPSTPVKSAHYPLASPTASGASGGRINLSGKSMYSMLPLL